MAVLRRAGSFLLLSALIAAAQSDQPAAEWLPEGAVVALHVNRPGALLDLAATLKLPEMLAGNPLDPGVRLLLDTLSKGAGVDWKGLIRQFTGGGTTYALYPGDNPVWIFDAQNALVLDVLQQFAKSAAGARVVAPASAKSSAAFYQEYPGNVVAWSLDGKQFFARTGNRLVLASRSETLKALFSPRTQGRLASSPLYSRAKLAVAQRAHDPAAWLFLNMTALNQYSPSKKALETGTEPLSIILNGAVKQALRDSTWLATGLDIEGKKLRLHAITDGKLTATGAGAFTLPADSGILPNLSVPGEIAAASLWRDLGQFYSRKEAFFPEKTSGGVLAENFLEIFFTGRDLNEEVFSRFQPQVRLVIARQQYDPKVGTPVEQYPAAALVFRVKGSAADFGEILEEAWQKAVGLTNFTRGQQALPGLILDRQQYGGIPFTYGYFSARTEKDRAQLPSRFNLRPAIVRDGPYIIFSTTDGLARDLIDAVNKEDARNPAERSGAHTRIEVTGPAEIAALLNVNKAVMVRQTVLTSGKSPEQAARDFDKNVAWLDKFEHASLSLAATPQGHQADLELDLK